MSLFLALVMVLNASCAGMGPRAEPVAEDAPDGGGVGLSMTGGLMSLAAVTALIVGAVRVKDKTARILIWSGIGGMVIAGVMIDREERIRSLERGREKSASLPVRDSERLARLGEIKGVASPAGARED